MPCRFTGSKGRAHFSAWSGRRRQTLGNLLSSLPCRLVSTGRRELSQRCSPVRATREFRRELANVFTFPQFVKHKRRTSFPSLWDRNVAFLRGPPSDR